jgi:large subunit ribosomal protein L13
MVVIDGSGMVFGRLASQIAKSLLNGEEIQLINADQMLISGHPKVITKRFQARREIQNKGTPEYSPKWSKVPHLLVKRMIRGMLPNKTARGREAHRKLLVYTGNPKNLKPEEKFKKITVAKGVRKMKIVDLCRLIGYNG